MAWKGTISDSALGAGSPVAAALGQATPPLAVEHSPLRSLECAEQKGSSWGTFLNLTDLCVVCIDR